MCTPIDRIFEAQQLKAANEFIGQNDTWDHDITPGKLQMAKAEGEREMLEITLRTEEDTDAEIQLLTQKCAVPDESMGGLTACAALCRDDAVNVKERPLLSTTVLICDA